MGDDALGDGTAVQLLERSGIVADRILDRRSG